MSRDPNPGIVSDRRMSSANGPSVAASSREDPRDAESLALVRRFQTGERSAYGRLYRLWFDSIRAYAAQNLLNRADDEDAAEDVFAGVLESLPRYEASSPEKVRAWLFAIARNVVLNRNKKERREQGRVDAEASGELEKVCDPSAESELERALGWITDPELLSLVEDLSEAQRQALTLCFRLDLPPQQMADLMDRGTADVYQLLRRARCTLNEQLGDGGRRRLRGRRRAPILKRITPLPVLGARRFVLAGPMSRPWARALPASNRYRTGCRPYAASCRW